MDTSKNTQQGSGSAENKNEGRESQQNPNTHLSKQDKQKVAGEMAKGPNPVADLSDLGALSGRDDASGGSGDRMEDESTGAPTDR
jgi:hypothetical protein